MEQWILRKVELHTMDATPSFTARLIQSEDLEIPYRIEVESLRDGEISILGHFRELPPAVEQFAALVAQSEATQEDPPC